MCTVGYMSEFSTPKYMDFSSHFQHCRVRSWETKALLVRLPDKGQAQASKSYSEVKFKDLLKGMLHFNNGKVTLFMGAVGCK